MSPVPVTVVTGFLGAGKTTLVDRWLESHGDDYAVIVNEHAVLGVDAELLAERAKRLIEISGGCVCCTTHGELVQALDQLATAAVQRIVIETSGAASPAGVLRAVQRGGREQRFALDGVITVVDASRLGELRTQDLLFEQIGYADVVIMSRADTCPSATMAVARDLVARQNAAATLLEASRGRIAEAPSLEQLLATRGELPTAAPAHVDGAHVYESVSLAEDGDLDGERFAAFVETTLGARAGRIFRTKGILSIEGVSDRMIVQGVADTLEVSFGAAWGEAARNSRLVVVGYALDGALLARGFRACVARRR